MRRRTTHLHAQAERSGVDFDKLYASIGEGTALGRIPSSEDVAHGVRFLVSDPGLRLDQATGRVRR